MGTWCFSLPFPYLPWCRWSRRIMETWCVNCLCWEHQKALSLKQTSSLSGQTLLWKLAMILSGWTSLESLSRKFWTKGKEWRSSTKSPNLKASFSDQPFENSSKVKAFWRLAWTNISRYPCRPRPKGHGRRCLNLELPEWKRVWPAWKQQMAAHAETEDTNRCLSLVFD